MGEGEVTSEVREGETRPVKSFTTAMGSVYTYDGDGKTTRFKTATNEQYVRQDITIFVKLDPDEEQEVLHAYLHEDENDRRKRVDVIQRQKDDSGLTIHDVKDITDPDNLYLGIVVDGQIVKNVKASTKPVMGSNVFDTRTYEENGQRYRARHLGNKVIGIEYGDSPISAAEVAEKPVVVDHDQIINASQQEIDVLLRYLTPDVKNSPEFFEIQNSAGGDISRYVTEKLQWYQAHLDESYQDWGKVKVEQELTHVLSAMKDVLGAERAEKILEVHKKDREKTATSK